MWKRLGGGGLTTSSEKVRFMTKNAFAMKDRDRFGGGHMLLFGVVKMRAFAVCFRPCVWRLSLSMLFSETGVGILI